MESIIRERLVERVNGMERYRIVGIECVECGGDEFLGSYGEVEIGGVRFDGYRCCVCSRGVALEIGSYERVALGECGVEKIGLENKLSRKLLNLE